MEDVPGSSAILSVGSINADFQLCVERRPDISETVVGKNFVRLGGGKAANVAFCIHRLGGRARLFGSVGDDELAEQALAPLRKLGLDLSHVHRVPGDTGFAMISVPPDGKKGIVMASNANERWTEAMAADLEQGIAAAGKGALLVIDCEIPDSVLWRAVRAAQSSGLAIILDPSPANRVTRELIEAVDVVTPNPSEAEQLLGEEMKITDADSAARASKALLEMGVGLVCLKLPDGGCVWRTREGGEHVGQFPVQVVDTTGAGDAFAGALAFGLWKGMPTSEAVKLAVATSHLTVAAFGSQPALPDWPSVVEACKRLEVKPLHV